MVTKSARFSATTLGGMTVPRLLSMAEAADRERLFDSVWVGDAMRINRRLVTEGLPQLND